MKKDVIYSTIKCKLTSILEHDEFLPLIKDRVEVVNKIWVEAYNLFNLFILNKLRRNHTPHFTCTTIDRCVLFVIGKSNSIRGQTKTTMDIQKQIDDTLLKLNNENNEEIKIKLDKTMNVLKKEKKRLIEYKDLKIMYTLYSKLKNNKLEETNFDNIDSIKRPFEYLSQQIMVNIMNHISLNFHKFQKRYLKAKVFDIFSRFKINKSNMYSILNCIKYHVNNKIDTVKIISKKLLKLNNISILKDIMINIILEEKMNMPRQIFENVLPSNLKKNYGYVLKYYYHMINYLEHGEKKRFSLIPQLNFGYTYIKFDKRFISTIYNEWINKLLTEANNCGSEHIRNKYNIDYPLKNYEKKKFNKERMNELLNESNTFGLNNVKKKYNIDYDLDVVKIKQFEANYHKYYDRCFNFKQKLKKIGSA
jgi:hypothetical protein